MKKHFDMGSVTVILVTFVLFAVALTTKGITQDMLLEAGVLLVSIKLIMQAYKTSVANQEVTRSSPARFFDIEYPLVANLIEGKEKVTVRFQATEGNVVAAIFGIRMIRADAER